MSGSRPLRVRVASFRRRVLADAVDLTLLLGLNGGLWLGGITRPDLPAPRYDALDHLVTLATEHRALFRAPLVLLLCSGVLLALLGRGLWGRTPGEALCRLRVIDAEGRPLEPLRTLARSLLTALGVAMLGLGYTVALVDRHRRTLADLVCGTLLVVDRAAPPAPPRAPTRPVHGVVSARRTDR